MPTIKNGETWDCRGAAVFDRATSLTFRDGQINRSAMAEVSLADFTLRMDDWWVWDDLDSPLPDTAAADDLALIRGTFGSNAPVIQTSDAKATTVTQRMRRQLILPTSYRAGQDVQLVLRAGMDTTISDDTATVDVECYAFDGDGGIGSELCQTAAQTINSLTKADKTFVINAASLAPGDTLDFRVTVAITDSATGTAVIGEISQATLQLDIL
jgi:hypothetical protein